MTREIRVTIDDDEVFERMRNRKRELDLSWREVIHRGLQETEPGDLGDRIEHQIRQRVTESLETAFGVEAEPAAGVEAEPAAGVEPESSHETPPEPSEGLSAEMESLSNAENAMLRFPFLSDEPGSRVPLRVQLETTADGLDVTVVTVRTGKSVAGENAFDRGARREIAAALADDQLAELSLANGAETYRVVPALSWQAAETGPTVTDAEIREVRFDG